MPERWQQEVFLLHGPDYELSLPLLKVSKEKSLQPSISYSPLGLEFYTAKRTRRNLEEKFIKQKRCIYNFDTKCLRYSIVSGREPLYSDLHYKVANLPFLDTHDEKIMSYERIS
jgi:hypothetical protein